MKKKIKEKHLDYLFLALLCFIFVGMFMHGHFASDTYFLEAYGLKNNAIHPYFSDGRLVMTAFLMAFHFFKVPVWFCRLCSWGFAFLSLVGAAWLLYYNLKKESKNKPLALVVSFASVVGLFVVELLTFAEFSGVTCFSIFLSVCVLHFLLKYFKDHKNKKVLLWALLCSILAVFSYQGTFSLIVLFPLVFTLLYSKNVRSFILNNIVIALIYGIPALLNLVYINSMGSSRKATQFNLIETFAKIKDGCLNLMKDTFTILPSYVYCIMIALFIGLICYLLIRNKAHFSKYLFLIYMLIAIFFVTFFPQIAIDSKFIWIVPRSNIALGSILGFLGMYYLLYCDEKKDVSYLKVIICLFVVLFTLQYIGWTNLANSHYANNRMEQEEAMHVVEMIQHYEEATSHTITKIAFYQDEFPKYQYNGITAIGDINIRVPYISWAYPNLLTYTMERTLAVVDKEESFEKFCSSQNWNYFDEKQIQFIDDTIHICSY